MSASTRRGQLRHRQETSSRTRPSRRSPRALGRASGGSKEAVVIINADANATHQSVIHVMEAARLGRPDPASLLRPRTTRK